MRDLKIRPGMDTPKAKQKNPTPKDAESILKKHMDKRQKEKEPESRDPVRYATDRVEKICAVVQLERRIPRGV